MKNGLSSPIPKDKLSTSEDVDDTRETVYTFLDKVSRAKMEGDEWIETTPEIIHHYNRSGLNGAKFFIYDGVKVCENGMREKIETDMNEAMGIKIHGTGEAKVL